MEIKKVCVVGIGVMGHGITQVCAQAGYETSVVDLTDEILEKGMNNIKNSLSKFVKKGKMTQEEMDKIIGRIKPTTSLEEGAKDADYVIEAVFEDVEVKKEVFKKLDEICPSHTILGTNTSTIPITLIGSATKRPEKVIGAHFMNPPPLMPGVEVITGLRTSKETLDITLDFIKSLGKETVVVKDTPGFVTNRIIHIVINEGVKLLEEGVASAEDIDKICRLCFNWPMGPLQLADLIGLDIATNVLESIYQETGWEWFKPAKPLKRMKEAGWLGRKTGKGFYEYK
ncbi:MAG: 3-hydroxyacyl-CoA dehydrogenase family protein [Candidatus Methanospirareceae archaeon]